MLELYYILKWNFPVQNLSTALVQAGNKSQAQHTILAKLAALKASPHQLMV